MEDQDGGCRGSTTSVKRRRMPDDDGVDEGLVDTRVKLREKIEKFSIVVNRELITEDPM